MRDETPFWKGKSLAEMTEAEWESLCDGCAKCCLVKLQDDDTGEVAYTRLACRLLDLTSCRCSDYGNRARRVPDCVVLTPERITELAWMPSTCAYRLLAEGKDLPDWHPLVTGNAESVHDAGISVYGRVRSEVGVPARRLADFIDPGIDEV